MRNRSCGSQRGGLQSTRSRRKLHAKYRRGRSGAQPVAHDFHPLSPLGCSLLRAGPGAGHRPSWRRVGRLGVAARRASRHRLPPVRGSGVGRATGLWPRTWAASGRRGSSIQTCSGRLQRRRQEPGLTGHRGGRSWPGVRESRHFRSVTVGVAGFPARLDGVQAPYSRNGSEQPVTAIQTMDARICSTEAWISRLDLKPSSIPASRCASAAVSAFARTASSCPRRAAACSGRFRWGTLGPSPPPPG